MVEMPYSLILALEALSKTLIKMYQTLFLCICDFILTF